jgi:hypothetical protein
MQLAILPRVARFCADRQYVATDAIASFPKIEAEPSQRQQSAQSYFAAAEYMLKGGASLLPRARRTSPAQNPMVMLNAEKSDTRSMSSIAEGM